MRESLDTETRDQIVRAEHPMIVECRASAPYSGCFWEYNYWLLSGSGDIHPLYVSGMVQDLMGGTHASMILNGMKTNRFVDVMTTELQYRYDTFDVYEVRDADIPYNWINMISEILVHVFGAPAEHLPDWKCDQCGEKKRGVAHFLGYHGDGGVGIELTDPCCDDCFYTLKYCDSCYKEVVPEQIEDDEYHDPVLRCPNRSEDDDRPHVLCDLEDQAATFNMDGAAIEYMFDGRSADLVWPEVRKEE